ncbi:hypothetical protein TD95_001390 [Thielaviopsis punctulata]|uniref:DUF3074 domain-containing protein n=1 Tax=Thielaviopsis punctulata TaxID=72032 RepID=A0A0F4Z748_9PEZI|nr:hypothetical protein TD95_001390 [Thielaviopsis punctulata]
MSVPAPLGPFVRLWGLKMSELPQPSSPSDELLPFVLSILEEAVSFLDSIPSYSNSQIPQASSQSSRRGLWKAKGAYPYPGCDAKIEAYERVVSTSELKDIAAKNNIIQDKSTDFHSEFWTCRRSLHEDASRKGTANWAEFLQCFRDHHAEAEDLFTDSIIETNTAAEWRCEGITARIGEKEYGRITLKLEESRHHIGSPLKDRVFAVLQMTATVLGTQEFVVVSIAITETESSPICALTKKPGVVTASYTSVERIRKVPAGTIEWTMATASDARGVLPAWLQALSVPAKIRKDVPMFLVWLANQNRQEIQQGIFPQ